MMLKERFLNWAAKIHLIFRYKQAFFSIFTLFFIFIFASNYAADIVPIIKPTKMICAFLR